MPNIDIVEPHSLGVEVAKARLKTLMDGDGLFTLTERHWDEAANTFTFVAAVSGITVRGRVVVSADAVELTTEQLPIVAIPFIASSRERIRLKLREVLQP